jgi:tetratricopeptide (TPR) repeat protein
VVRSRLGLDGESMDDQLRELVALAREHFQRGDYSLAAGHLEQAVARGVAFADVHHMLGVVYHHLGEFAAAQRALEKALAINPNYVEAGLNLAIVCNDLGQYERAQQVYGAALSRARSRGKREPNGDEPMDNYTRGKIANLHAAVADGYLSMRRPNDAAAEYRRALSLCPTFVDLRLRLAHALREANDIDGAVAEFRLAAQHAPAYLPARVSLGMALYASGKLDEALAQWQEVLRIDPQHRIASVYLKLARSQPQRPGT